MELLEISVVVVVSPTFYFAMIWYFFTRVRSVGTFSEIKCKKDVDLLSVNGTWLTERGKVLGRVSLVYLVSPYLAIF